MVGQRKDIAKFYRTTGLSCEMGDSKAKLIAQCLREARVVFQQSAIWGCLFVVLTTYCSIQKADQQNRGIEDHLRQESKTSHHVLPIPSHSLSSLLKSDGCYTRCVLQLYSAVFLPSQSYMNTHTSCKQVVSQIQGNMLLFTMETRTDNVIQSNESHFCFLFFQMLDPYST